MLCSSMGGLVVDYCCSMGGLVVAGGDASVVMLFGIQVSMFVRMYFIHKSSSHNAIYSASADVEFCGW